MCLGTVLALAACGRGTECHHHLPVNRETFYLIHDETSTLELLTLPYLLSYWLV